MHKKIRLNAAATAGLLIILFFLIIAVFAPVIAPYDPKEMIASYLPPTKSTFWEPTMWARTFSRRWFTAHEFPSISAFLPLSS